MVLGVIVGDEDTDLLKRHWFLDHHGHVFRMTSTSGIKYNVRLAKIILERKLERTLKSNEQVDHKNGDKLDNRRTNLRIATNRQNQMNKGKRSNAIRSKYKGVGIPYAGAKFQARIRVHGKSIHLGMFVHEIDAARAYDKAAKLHFGRFAKLNNV